jgi:Fungalysin metallopeptidase (M36)/Fungalysin/Thermolysin Propeptide Motif
MDRSIALLIAFLGCSLFVHAQTSSTDPITVARAALVANGINAEDLAQLRIADSYVDAHNGIRHTWLRQQWQGIDIFNSEVAVHQRANGDVVALLPQVVQGLAGKAGSPEPGMPPADALRSVLSHDGVHAPMPALMQHEASANTWRFAGDDFSGEEPFAELVWLRIGDALTLAWNVNYYSADGSHWWNVRIDANTGTELERNDWVASCGFDTGCAEVTPVDPTPIAAPAPAAPNDLRVYPQPVFNPDRGARALRNAPWTLAPIASPFGWHDTNGAAGAEYTITRGNNVYASEDVNADNLPGFSPNSATLDFDYPLNLANAPSTYQSAAITNLFYWNNLMHDVFYRYGFDEVSGNFQSNNYGRGGAEGDFLYADGQDGSGTNNGNFGTPPDGSNPREQLFVYTFTTPHRDGCMDGNLITHEYGHGISRRLVGGPSNVNGLNNQDQMGEGWSDWIALMMTMKVGDNGANHGNGSYLLGQPVNGPGIRPVPYSTDIAVNSLTYDDTNNSALLPNSHGVGTMWCTVLWDMTWDLIALHGFDPDLYNGNGGNNIALQLVIDGMKYTPSSPGFVDARNGILLADQITYGGAYQNLIWAVFAARGLGFSAGQGNPHWRFDQVEAFDLPTNNNVGVLSPITPAAGVFLDCDNGLPVTLKVRNNGLLQQGNFNVSYRVDGGAVSTQLFNGTLLPGFTTPITFPGVLTLVGNGVHTIKAWTSLPTDQCHTDDTLTFTVNWQANAQPTVTANAEDALLPPAGWVVENDDGLYTWSNVALTMGSNCAATRAFRMNYRTYNATAQEDRLVSPLINLAGSAGTHLLFHHAYAPYGSGLDDGLIVQVSADCGSNWTTLFSAFGAALGTAPQNTNQWVPTACNQWLLHDIDLSAYDGQRIQVRFVGECHFGNDLFLDNITILNNGVRLVLKLMLEGPYDPGTLKMRDDLRVAGIIPNAEPYTGFGFAQASDGGGEVLQPGATSTTGDNAVVDWVLVELRNAITPTTIVATRTALVQRDGDVVAEDGLSPISLLAAAGNYHVAIRHRNHLGAMTSTPVALNGTPLTLDFTNGSVATYGTDAQKINGTKRLLWTGNAVHDGLLKYTGTTNDRDPILTRVGGTVPTATANGYWPEDHTLDGVVKYTGISNDRDPILVNIGGTVPTATRVEQLP